MEKKMENEMETREYSTVPKEIPSPPVISTL